MTMCASWRAPHPVAAKASTPMRSRARANLMKPRCSAPVKARVLPLVVVSPRTWADGESDRLNTAPSTVAPGVVAEFPGGLPQLLLAAVGTHCGWVLPQLLFAGVGAQGLPQLLLAGVGAHGGVLHPVWAGLVRPMPWLLSH